MPSADSFLSACNALMCGQPPRKILLKAIALLENPERWCQGAWARDAHGRRVHPADPHAVCWDLEAAVAVSCNQHAILPPYFMVVLDEAAEELFHHPYGASLFNEHYSHGAVLQLLRAALDRVPEV